jgi:hypothetical protein
VSRGVVTAALQKTASGEHVFVAIERVAHFAWIEVILGCSSKCGAAEMARFLAAFGRTPYTVLIDNITSCFGSRRRLVD